MAIRGAGHHVIGTSAPSESPVAVGYLWSDTANNLLKLCTSISPYTFSTLSGGSGAPTDAKYIVQTGHADLSAEQILADLATGILKVTTTTGVLSTATEGTDYYKPGGTDVAVVDGGTGASTAGGARTNLGLGTIATQDANNVSISGGSVSGITDLAIADGGTGASTATAAFDALAPTTTQGDLIYFNGTDNVRLAAGSSGQLLKTQGSSANPVWANSKIVLTQSSGDATDGYNPVDGATNYVIADGVDPATIASAGGVAFGVTIPASGTITEAYVQHVVFGTNGLNGENITYRLRKNDTTDSDIIAQLDTDVDGASGSNTALGFAVTAGDKIVLKIVNPVFTTNPTVMYILGTYVLEIP
jgi:hypothetical protein